MTAFPSASPQPGTHDPDLAALVAGLAAPDASVRRIALFELADLEDPGLVPAFVAALRDDPSADVRGEAARVLGAWEQPDVVDALCGALLDPDDGVRAAAAQSLSELKDAASGPVLCRWADRPEPFARGAVLRGLREARVIFVAIAQQRVELLGGRAAVALRGAELLRGGVEVFLRAVEQQLQGKAVSHLGQPP